MADYHYSPYQDNRNYDANASYRQSPGGYGYPPQSPPPQDNNTMKIIMIVAGAVIAIAIMVIVGIILMSQNKQQDQSSASATASGFTGASQPTTAAKQKMPDLKGLAKDDAIARLTAMGVTVKEVKEIETDKARAGFVYDQVPSKNVEIQAGDTVTLYVAKQKSITVPSTAQGATAATAATSATSATTPTQAPTVYLYCIASDFVSLRTGKGTEYTELVKVPSRASMVYLRTDGNWYYVRYGGYEGYVHGDYVSFDADTPVHTDSGSNSSPKTYTSTLRCIADDYVSLRIGPDKSYSEQVRIPSGATMTFINYSDVDSNWYYVQYGNTKGFVYSQYVEFI